METTQPHPIHRADISEALSYGWNKMKQHMGLLIGAILLQLVIVFGLNLLMSFGWEWHYSIGIIALIAYIIMNVLLQLGLIRIGLVACDEKTPTISMLFTEGKYFFRFLGGSILYNFLLTGVMLFMIMLGLIIWSISGIVWLGATIAILGGLAGLIVGWYWAIKYSMFMLVMLDEDLSIMDSFRRSAQIMRGHMFEMIALYLVLSLINFAGMLFLFVGLLITIPMTLMAGVHFYRTIKGMPPTVRQPYVPPAATPAV